MKTIWVKKSDPELFVLWKLDGNPDEQSNQTHAICSFKLINKQYGTVSYRWIRATEPAPDYDNCIRLDWHLIKQTHHKEDYGCDTKFIACFKPSDGED